MNDLAHCPRTPVTPTSCEVPMATLRADFGLLQGELIVVRVKAANRIGYGDYSEINTDGALIAVEPHQMIAPYQGTDIDINKIEVKWFALEDLNQGGSPVQSYNL